MIPIFPDEVLHKNPQFQAVFQDLKTNKLNPDASSKLSNQSIKESQDVDKRLTVIREDLARTKIIRQRLIHTLNDLPADLREVIDLYLSSQNSGAVLRKDDEAFFLEGLPLICKSLNKILLEDATDLANMCTSDINPDPNPFTLPSTISARLDTLDLHRQSLHQIRCQSLQRSLQLAELNRNLISSTIKLVEQTKHGLTARAQKTQAKHLSLVSDSLDGKVKIMYFEALDRLYDQDTVNALAFYKEHLEDTKVRLKKQMRKAEGELEEYEGFGEGVKRDVVKYAQILEDIEQTKADIRRLGGDA
ncbi:hypothetical protein H072_956 [Dactylellina haptotyla CBS 200.50]|uniref:Uncharacterized protein n=1 Tax=Dactylellina haptotyla (strain CBS 200.50) TaxID=1284197 RepID=S8CB96_DACHA|nr:hypothetical protein H072_956 [Dactylellina haptotyla CBS 200.50]